MFQRYGSERREEPLQRVIETMKKIFPLLCAVVATLFFSMTTQAHTLPLNLPMDSVVPMVEDPYAHAATPQQQAVDAAFVEIDTAQLNALSLSYDFSALVAAMDTTTAARMTEEERREWALGQLLYGFVGLLYQQYELEKEDFVMYTLRHHRAESKVSLSGAFVLRFRLLTEDDRHAINWAFGAEKEKSPVFLLLERFSEGKLPQGAEGFRLGCDTEKEEVQLLAVGGQPEGEEAVAAWKQQVGRYVAICLEKRGNREEDSMETVFF